MSTSNAKDPLGISNDTPAAASDLGSLGFAAPASNFNFFRFDEFGPLGGGASDRVDYYRFQPVDLASARVAINPIGYDQFTNYAGAMTYTLITAQGTTSVAFLWDGGNRNGVFNDMLASYRAQYTHVIYEGFDNFQVTLPLSGSADVLVMVSGVLEVYSAAGTPAETAFSYRIDIMPDTGALSSGDSTDLTRGTAGNDRISFSTLSSRDVDGGAGIDTVSFQDETAPFNFRAHWVINANSGIVKVQDYHQFPNVERFLFSDMALAFDLNGNAGAVAKILGAVFGASYVQNREFVGIGLNLMDAGVSYLDLAALAVATPVFQQLAGGTSHQAFVNHVYKNVVGALPSQSELNLYVGLLNNGTYTQGSLAMAAAELAQNGLNIDLTGLAATGLEYIPVA